MVENRTDRITLKITPTIKVKAKEAAAGKGRSLSNYIENLIVEDLKSKKIL